MLFAYIFLQREKQIYISCNELFVTHAFGGGTKIYENNYLLTRRDVAILRNVRGIKTSFCLIEFNDEKKYIPVKKINDFFTKSNFMEITVNSLVPYTNFNQILNCVVDYRKKNECYVRYMIHDFHSVCPNFTLIANDKFCGMECDKFNCKFCISKHYLKNISISLWREYWISFLTEIDEIRVFSNSSKEILQRTYAKLEDSIFNIIPHDMTYCKYKPYIVRTNEPRRIAFVGTCDTIAKGNKIINNFIEQNEKYEICLLGKIPLTKSLRDDPKVINLGAYKQSELPMLMEKYNISTIIFPSICSETFSYTISEQILLGVNILSFDIGAQGEKVRNYKKGFIVQEMSSQALINKLEEINGLL